MSSVHKNLSAYIPSEVPDASNMRFGIVTAEWNPGITHELTIGAHNTLLQHNCPHENIKMITVPGSFELVSGAQLLTENFKLDAVICLGCVIQGETRHFDFICDAVAQGLIGLSLKFSKPFIFGVLTTNTLEQAQDRAGGKHGNKGIEAAITAIKMAYLKNTIKENKTIGF